MKKSTTFTIVILAILPAGAMAEQTSRGIAVISADLATARAAYAAETNLPRRDCDPSGDGRWICASYQNPQLSDFSEADLPNEPGQPGQPGEPGEPGEPGQPNQPNQPSEPSPPAQPASNSSRTAIIGDTLADARRNFNASTGYGPADCDPVGDGRWICGNFNNPRLSDVDSSNPSNGGSASGGNTETNSNISSGETIPADAWFQPGDLISLHYDSCPDADDIHASVSGKMVLDHHGLSRNTDYVVVNGACGYARPRSDYIENSERIFDRLYGAQSSTSTWLNAFSQQPQSASTVAARFRTTLDAGHRVWIAEGGPMDFTAEVIRTLERSGFSGRFSDIKIVQHSHGNGFNERNTSNANLAYLRSRAEYVTIDNGNLGNNRTAQLNQNSNGNPVYPPVDGNLVNRFRNNNVYGDAWNLAFSIFNPGIRFDGSDTVALLWIFGLQSEDIADWYDFADEFLPEGNQSTTSSTSSAQNGASIRFEAESASLGNGWVVNTNRSGYTGSGYIRWNGGNAYSISTAGRGITRYAFTAPSSGVFQLRLRARAIDPPRGDLNNDAWFRMNGQDIPGTNGFRNWVKIYTSGGDNWRSAGTADFARDEKFRQRLFAGRSYVLELSGRSQNYAIDHIELIRNGN